jgi:acyl-CoA thioesterase FadM
MDEMPAPFATYRTEVRSEWLDYNGHMHDASYAVAFSDANEELFEALDLSADYRERTGAAFYTVETHLRFLAECGPGQTLTAATTVVDADPKKMRLYTELSCDGVLAATAESMYVHVDPALGASTDLPSDRHAQVQQLLAAHADLPRPPHLGGGVGAAREKAGQP